MLSGGISNSIDKFSFKEYAKTTKLIRIIEKEGG